MEWVLNFSCTFRENIWLWLIFQWELDDSKFYVRILKNRLICECVHLEALWLPYIPHDFNTKILYIFTTDEYRVYFLK
jgi:hypothetical protein